jgi:hypothetical protein
MATRKQITVPVNESTNYELSFSIDQDLTGETIEAICQLTDGTGAIAELGTTSGLGENVTTSIEMETSALDVGQYYVEFWINRGTETAEMVVPDAGVQLVFDVQERIGG